MVHIEETNFFTDYDTFTFTVPTNAGVDVATINELKKEIIENLCLELSI